MEVDYAPLVDAALDHILSENGLPPSLHNMIAYHLGWADAEGRLLPARMRAQYGGKKMRAALCILVCEAAGGKASAAVPAAAAIELVQNFSLVHDDIEDGDTERRHRPTVWVQWGVPHAINAGSAMQALVNSTVLHTEASPDTVLDLLGALTAAMVEMTEGQHLDIAFQARPEVSVTEYEDMAARKTGALIEAAAYCGARIATADAERLAAWRRFGRAFGRAFQARDDLLGVIGDPSLTGKPVGNDIRARKKALPLVFAWAGASSQDRASLAEALAEDPVSDAAVERVTALMDRCGALTATRAAVDAATIEALAELDHARPDGPAAERIRRMVRQAVGRRH